MTLYNTGIGTHGFVHEGEWIGMEPSVAAKMTAPG